MAPKKHLRGCLFKISLCSESGKRAVQMLFGLAGTQQASPLGVLGSCWAPFQAFSGFVSWGWLLSLPQAVAYKLLIMISKRSCGKVEVKQHM
jgi:hypothetical protein